MSSSQNIDVDDTSCNLILQSYNNCIKVRPGNNSGGCNFLLTDMKECIRAKFTSNKEEKNVSIS